MLVTVSAIVCPCLNRTTAILHSQKDFARFRNWPLTDALEQQWAGPRAQPDLAPDVESAQCNADWIWPDSGLQLLDSCVSVANSHAQFTSESRQKLNRNIWMLLTQDGKRRLAQAKTCEVFVSRDGGRARPAVEKRKLTKNCAGRKGHKPNALVIVPKMNTRPASGDEIKGRARIAVPKDDMTGRPGHRLQPNTQPFDLFGREVA